MIDRLTFGSSWELLDIKKGERSYEIQLFLGNILMGSDLVKCRDCGFMAVRTTPEMEIAEANERFRESGGPDSSQSLDPFPVCFAMKANLSSEVSSSHTMSHKSEPLYKSVFKVLDRERKCDGFIPYQLGFSPKEHHDVQILEEQRRFQESRLQADREFRERQDGKMREWQEKQGAKAFTKQVIVFGIIVTLTLVMAQIFGAFVPIIWGE